MTIDTKNDFTKVEKFLSLMNKKNKLFTYSIDEVISYLKKINHKKYLNKRTKKYIPNTNLDWDIFS